MEDSTNLGVSDSESSSVDMPRTPRPRAQHLVVNLSVHGLFPNSWKSFQDRDCLSCFHQEVAPCQWARALVSVASLQSDQYPGVWVVPVLYSGHLATVAPLPSQDCVLISLPVLPVFRIVSRHQFLPLFRTGSSTQASGSFMRGGWRERPYIDIDEKLIKGQLIETLSAYSGLHIIVQPAYSLAFTSDQGIKQLFFYVVFHMIHGYLCLDTSTCNGTLRAPAYTDILVTCGPQNIELSVYLCPVYFAGYNETQLYMNDIFTKPQCQGRVDTSGSVPFLKFTFSVNDSSTCGSSFVIDTAKGEGVFQDFSNIQTVNISGIITSKDPNIGVVSYNPELKYLYSCKYPMEYLINNTKLDVNGNSVAINTNNGSFISTLSLQLFVDENYTRPLIIPSTGIKLKTTVFVEVRAINLTEKFNVLLDRCYASTSPYPTNSTYYDLFIGCTKDQYTVIKINGDSQYARFSFSSFRFLEQYNQPMSTFYLHCITRLCEISSCSSLKPPCARKRREIRADTASTSNSVSEPTTISSPGIITMNENAAYAICARSKSPRHFPVGLLQLVPSGERPWSHLSVDFMVELPVSKRHMVILMTVDTFSKMAHFVPLKGLPSSKELAEIFAREVFRLNGVPKKNSQEIVSTAVGLGITVGFLALLCTLMGGIAYLMHRRLQKTKYLEKNNFH
ncbi:zona pellucida-like domain-containing protein 1 [Rhinophrynus dorsalis]